MNKYRVRFASGELREAPTTIDADHFNQRGSTWRFWRGEGEAAEKVAVVPDEKLLIIEKVEGE